MDFAHPMDPAGIKKNSFCRRCFACVNMGNDADVAHSFDRIVVRHKSSSLPMLQFHTKRCGADADK
jgi:hypothetical protein